jgi:hypothetical protein
MYNVATSATVMATEAVEIIPNLCLCLLVVEHNPKFMSEVFLALVRGMNTDVKVELANSFISKRLRAYANHGSKDNWDKQLPLT